MLILPQPSLRNLRKLDCEAKPVSTFAEYAPDHEKKATFSAWLMRRIGASGSDCDALGLRTIPLAISVEPREG